MESKEKESRKEEAVEAGQTKNKSQSSKSDSNSKYLQQNGSKQNHKNAQKSGRPCREIYRPPSLRSKSSRNSQKDRNRDRDRDRDLNCIDSQSNSTSSGSSCGSGSGSNNCGNGNKSNSHSHSNTNGNSGGGGNKSHMNQNGNCNLSNLPVNVNGGSSSANNSPMVNRRSFVNGSNMSQSQRLGVGNLNANAKEFQLTQSQQQQQLQGQQIAALLSQLDSKFYSEVLAASSNLYALQQSKSLGNNLNLLQQQLGQNFGPSFGGYTPFGPYPPNAPGPGGGFLNTSGSGQFPIGTKPQAQNLQAEVPSMFNRLTQSKSSGSIPTIVTEKPRVRFDDTVDNELTFNTMRNAESRFSALNLNGLQQGSDHRQAGVGVGSTPAQLQKSRTGFLLNLYTPQQGILKHDSSTSNEIKVPSTSAYQEKGLANSVKRSRSFGSSGKFSLAPPRPISSVYSDFRISKWPRRVQETVTTAVTAVERIAARQQIEMVNLIFEAMLHYEPVEVGTEINQRGSDADSPNWRSSDSAHETDDDDCEGLTAPAVHIFLYFIQKEKDRTVMESLLNTCFATYQKLFGNNANEGGLKESSKLGIEVAIFLKFLSMLYSQVRLLRSQRQQNGGVSIDEMSFSLLALLCDSCLALLRSRFSNDPPLMSVLFTLMTSQGRDMETTFPLKMKQLLAAVRDTLLGLGPYCKGPLCSSVQRTLMQLIELHAANWQLPASAVRYYYSTNTSAGKSGQNQRSSAMDVVHVN